MHLKSKGAKQSTVLLLVLVFFLFAFSTFLPTPNRQGITDSMIEGSLIPNGRKKHHGHGGHVLVPRETVLMASGVHAAANTAANSSGGSGSAATTTTTSGAGGHS